MLTLVSWNIQYGKGVDGRIDLSRMAEVIHQDGLPDVLCLQEVSRNDPDTANGSDQVKYFRTTKYITEPHMIVVEEKTEGAGNSEIWY